MPTFFKEFYLLMDLVIASSNLHKVREIRDILKTCKNLKVDLLSLCNFTDYQALEETGSSFKENAENKALHAAKTLGKWVIADDSGLIVPALNGEPGVFSARYAGKNATDAKNRQKLIKKLQTLEEADRNAYFECCICLATPEGIKKTFSGKCEGTLLTEEKGNNGFGYDPIFIKYDYDKTFAELGSNTKNKISHRSKAIEKLALYLESLKS